MSTYEACPPEFMPSNGKPMNPPPVETLELVAACLDTEHVLVVTYLQYPRLIKTHLLTFNGRNESYKEQYEHPVHCVHKSNSPTGAPALFLAKLDLYS